MGRGSRFSRYNPPVKLVHLRRPAYLFVSHPLLSTYPMNRILLTIVASIFPILSVYAKGPTGLGSLQIGMSKSAVENLQVTNGVHLTSAMTPYDYKNTPPSRPDEEIFDTFISTPLDSKPLKAALTFKNSILISINLTINPSTNTLETVKNQIKEKYGTGKIDDSRKEEQCIYKNGANFKIMSGSIYTTWIEELSQTEQIKTTLIDVSIETCPSNLRTDRTDPIKIQSLIFRKVKNIVEDQPRNIF